MSLFEYATKRGTLRRRLVHSPGLPHHQPSPQSASTSLRSAAVPTLTLMTVGLRLVSCWFGVVGCVCCPPRVRWVCTRWWCGWVPLAVVAFRLRLLLSFLVCRLQPSPSRVSLFPRFARLFRRSHCVRPALCCSLRSRLARFARLWMAGLRPPSLLAGSVAYGACPRGASLWLRHQKRWRGWRTALNDFACLRSSSWSFVFCVCLDSGLAHVLCLASRREFLNTLVIHSPVLSS